jgi:hypothetical protein
MLCLPLILLNTTMETEVYKLQALSAMQLQTDLLEPSVNGNSAVLMWKLSMAANTDLEVQRWGVLQ